jgi:hypothetical protein
VTPVNELGHAGGPVLQKHVVIAVLGDLLGFPFHDPEGHQIHRMPNLLAHRQFLQAHPAVLTDIVEQNRSYHRVLPDAHAHCIAGHQQRMHNVGIAAFTVLALMLLPGIGKGVQCLLHAGTGGIAPQVCIHFFRIEYRSDHPDPLLNFSGAAALSQNLSSSIPLILRKKEKPSVIYFVRKTITLSPALCKGSPVGFFPFFEEYHRRNLCKNLNTRRYPHG